MAVDWVSNPVSIWHLPPSVVFCVWALIATCTSTKVSHQEDSTNIEPNGRESNITNIIASNNAAFTTTEKPGVSCAVARIKCALRQGCGTALQSYMLDCADLMQGRTQTCDEFCKASLIALTSTEEGESLMNCLCSDNYCSESKGRLEVCRREVLKANARNAVVSCSVAHLICSADTSCSTALFYYDKHCRRMFNGRGCSFRCNNSISILERQKKAEKLSTCLCDGSEPFACQQIKDNMATLCFNQKDEKNIQKHEEETNQIFTPQPKAAANATTSSSPQLYSGYFSAVSCVLLMNGATVVELCSKIIRFTSCLFGLTSSMVVRWR